PAPSFTSPPALKIIETHLGKAFIKSSPQPHIHMQQHPTPQPGRRHVIAPPPPATTPGPPYPAPLRRNTRVGRMQIERSDPEESVGKRLPWWARQVSNLDQPVMSRVLYP